jgi:hypothetical protein
MTLKCEVIQDLLPSYIDRLTSEDSDHLVERHLNECDACKVIYNDMKQELPEIDESKRDISEKHEMKLMKRIKNKIITVIITIVATFSIIGFVIGLYGNVIFQEGNPIALISSIIELEFTDEKYVQYSTSPDKYISEFEPGSDRYKVVVGFMEEKGWAFNEQMGSGLVFKKDEEQMIIGTRQYTRNYYVWNIPEKETFN